MAALGLSLSGTAEAQVTTVRSNTFGVNNRPVLEIRLADEPGSSPTRQRMVVLTNGPVAGTTSLLTAVGDANDLVDSAVAPPTFTPVIASGTVFSVGGGCTRGNQVDFPYINGNRPLILRFTGGNPTVITPLNGNTNLYDSADCVVSGDGTETYFIFTNRTQSRIDFYRDRGAPTDLDQALVAFTLIKTPFAGGIRPAITNMHGADRTIGLLTMQTNGESRVRQFNVDTTSVVHNCLAGTQTPPPAGFTIPRGGEVAPFGFGQFSGGVFVAMGDFNADGQFDLVTVNPDAPGGCAVAPAPTPAGSVGGSLFTWSEMAAAVSPFTQLVGFFATQTTLSSPAGPTTSVPGPHAGKGGPHAGCAASNTEVVNAFVSAGVDTPTTIKLAHTNDTTPRPPAPGQGHVFRSSFDSDTNFISVFCQVFRGARSPPQ